MCQKAKGQILFIKISILKQQSLSGYMNEIKNK